MRGFASLLLCRAIVSQKVKPDWNLLTDFTTNYAVNTKMLSQMSGGRMAAKEEHGVVQLDIHQMRMQVKADGSVVLPPLPPPDEYHPPAPPYVQFLMGKNISYHAEFRFDATNGFASTRMHLDVHGNPPISSEFCVKLNVPPGILPVGAMVGQKLPQTEEKIQEFFDTEPHSDGIVDGQKVAIYSDPQTPLSLKFLLNGVPVEADYFGMPVLSFTDWHEGAGSIQEAGCNSHTSAMELLTKPGGAEMLEALDRAMVALEMMSKFTPAGNFLPPKPSLLVRDVAKEELSQMQGAGTFSWASTAVMGGIAGAFVSAAIVGTLWRPNKQLLKEPLITDA